MPPILRLLDRLLRPWLRRLPRPVKLGLHVGLGRLRSAVPRRFRPQPNYQQRVAAEVERFAGEEVVHDLPPIFHYWSNTWLRPQLEAFGFSSPDDFMALYAGRAIEAAVAAGRPARLVSLGCGNCDAEIALARTLRARGHEDFRIECVDINPAMLARGVQLAAEAGMEGHIVPVQGDFNHWQPNGRYCAIIANQSLHHVVELEHLFGQIEAALDTGGLFIASDMIGRNGHMRWPEAMAIVQEFWRELPSSYRWNRQLHRQENRLLNWDCSVVGFEGIRSQDILPLLVARFDFEFFFGFGNLIDPFIDRGFGPHFDADASWDRDFIDRVQQRDEAEMRAGTIKPTHMLAVMRARPWDGPCQYRGNLSPAFCVRPV